MSLASDFEKRLEKIVEGAFSKAFRSDVEPSEVGRRLLREQEGGKSVSVAAVYVPNSYVVLLSGEDFGRFEGLVPTLRREFVELLKANAKQRRWRPAGPVDVRFEKDEAVALGKFEVHALHQAGENVAEGLQETASLVLSGSDPPQSWKLDQPQLTLGRESSNEVVIADPNASRRHASVENREGDWWIADLGSTNGTLVNETMVKERRLVPGDRIKIGGVVLEYHKDA